ncbi:helix-hairpin-helix domain-containing protein [Anaerosolibacter sp.]|uniref:helix-hairpin-helix domain-containing protein n=1 Tax=Anaerosolibacter sp. TaxID=1872527 RepID=UPI0026035455|nr:helix-hairpin-helix domain-containing protein [Anaerosolibacter sp.]
MVFTKREKIILVLFIMLIITYFAGSYFISSLNKPQITMENEALTQESEEAPEIMIEQNDIKERKIAIDVIGEVIKPGLVILDDGTRVIDAIEAAGGLLESADRRKINLARLLKDEEQIYVPKIGENIEIQDSNNAVGQGVTNLGKININQATAVELEKLNGIGEALASRIIQYRLEKGEFKDIKDIMKVSGIGEKKFEGMKDQITVR